VDPTFFKLNNVSKNFELTLPGVQTNWVVGLWVVVGLGVVVCGHLGSLLPGKQLGGHLGSVDPARNEKSHIYLNQRYREVPCVHLNWVVGL